MGVAFETGTFGVLAALAAVTIQHSILASWWRDRLGRALFMLELAVALLLIPSLSLFLSDASPRLYGWHLWLGAVSRWLAVFALLYLMVAREGRRRRQRELLRRVLSAPLPGRQTSTRQSEAS